MDSRVVIHELSVVVVAQQHNPTILNPDFLKFNEIVPEGWELLSPPICTEMVAQVQYTNGVRIVSHQDKLIFSELFHPETDGGDVVVPAVVRAYLKTVPHVQYQHVGINPQGHVACATNEEASRYLRETFLVPGPWLDYGNELKKASITLVYDFEDCILNLTLDSGVLQVEDRATPVLVFAANYHHTLSGDTAPERLESALDVVAHWEHDIAEYRALVERFFKEQEPCT